MIASRLSLLVCLLACSSPAEVPGSASSAPAPGEPVASPPREPISPTAVAGEPSAAELELVEDVVLAHHSEIDACVEPQHATAPDLAGSIEVRWNVAVDGTVSEVALVTSALATAAAADGGEPARALERCVLTAVGTWSYPPVDEGHPVTVHHTFTLTGASPLAPSPVPAPTPGVGHGISWGSSTAGRTGTVRTGTASVSRGLSPEVVRRVVRRHVNEVRFCYELGLSDAQSLEGRVSMHFVVDATGATTAVAVGSSALRADGETDGGAAARRVEACLVTAVDRWMFPVPEGGASVTIEHPFVLFASDAEAAPSAPGRGRGTIGLGTMGTVGS